MRQIFILLSLVFIVTGYTNAQVGGFVNKAVELGDTVIIKLASTEGEIEWQKSYDKVNWEVIPRVQEQLTFKADQTTFFRVKTSIGNCNPYYSDSVSVSVIGEVVDIDGNTYQTIQIGDQVWMAENLRVTHFPDGSPIPLAKHDSAWAYIDGMAYCWYNNDSITYAEKNGALYNWAAIMNGSASSEAIPSGVQGICPDGWHVPSDAEWQILERTLGMNPSVAANENWNGTNEGSKLAGAKHSWQQGALTSNEAFGISGFNAQPAGDRTWDDESIFFGLGIYGTWWSATYFANKHDNVWSRYLQFDRQDIRRGGTWKWNGNSVRCVKNE